MRDIDTVLIMVSEAIQVGLTEPLKYVSTIPEWKVPYFPKFVSEITCSNLFVARTDFLNFVEAAGKRWVYLVYLHTHLEELRKQMDSTRIAGTAMQKRFAGIQLLIVLTKEIDVAIGDDQLEALTAKGLQVTLDFKPRWLGELTPSLLSGDRIQEALTRLK